MSSFGETVTDSVAEPIDDSPMLDARTHPVINTPYEEPRHHWELDAHGRAAEGRPPKVGRRPPHGILPVPKPKKVEPGQGVLEMSPDDINETVEEVRVHLRNWRSDRWEGATGVTRRLLAYWTRDNRHIRPFFAQMEAVETVIWLTETAQGRRYARDRIAPLSQEMNDDLVRWAIKMATGTGKTMVMAMLIVWHTLNDCPLGIGPEPPEPLHNRDEHGSTLAGCPANEFHQRGHAPGGRSEQLAFPG